MQKPFQQVKEISQYDSFHDAIIGTLSPIYGEREAQNIAKYMLPDLKDISTTQQEEILNRLAKSEPWQYIVGKESFYGLDFFVNPYTLIPRPETEELVFLILQNHLDQHLSLLDIGTGTGCIPISIKKNRKDWSVSACDISNGALETAQRNADFHQVDIHFFPTDILSVQELPQKWNIIVSNPPYIPEKEKVLLSKNVLDFEPDSALFVSDEQPLIFYEKIAQLGTHHLNSNGYLYFELNEFYADATKDLVEHLGYQKVKIIEDLMGKKRMLQAQWLYH